MVYPAASLYPLVHVVRKRFTGHEASRTLGGVEVPLLQHYLTLADDNQRPAPHLYAFKDVVLDSLQRRATNINQTNWCVQISSPLVHFEVMWL